MLRMVLTMGRVLLKLGVVTFCLFAYPVFAMRLQSTNNLELAKSIAIYSLGVIAVFLVVKVFRSMDKDALRLLEAGHHETPNLAAR